MKTKIKRGKEEEECEKSIRKSVTGMMFRFNASGSTVNRAKLVAI